MTEKLTIAAVALVVLVMIFFAANLFYTLKHEMPSKLFTRLLYISGILAAIVNGLRICTIYEDNQGTMLFADGLVIVCLLISFIRAERGKDQWTGVPEEDEDEES